MNSKTENPVVKARELQDQLDRLKTENAHLRVQADEYKLVQELGGLKKLNLPPEVEADVKERMTLGLDQDMAVQCALKQHEHNKKLTAKQQERAVEAEKRAKLTAALEEERAKEQAVLGGLVRELVTQAKAKAKGATA